MPEGMKGKVISAVFEVRTEKARTNSTSNSASLVPMQNLMDRHEDQQMLRVNKIHETDVGHLYLQSSKRGRGLIQLELCKTFEMVTKKCTLQQALEHEATKEKDFA